MHPEGALYWIHDKDVSPTPKRALHSDNTPHKPIYTDTNMCDPELRQQIEEALEEINELRGSCPPLPAGDWELALELGKDEETGEPICSYYFVCSSTRCLFWLHEFDPESLLAGLCGVTEWTHIRESPPVSKSDIPGANFHGARSGITSSVLVSSFAS
jgi:hypothetical protein